jgi:hypothetical protein
VGSVPFSSSQNVLENEESNKLRNQEKDLKDEWEY